MPGVSRTDIRQIRDLLARKVRVLIENAIRTDGHIPAEEVQNLEHLARLVEICEAEDRLPKPRKRWPVIAVLSATLAILSVLLFARVPQTEIELELSLSEVGFVLPTQQVLTDVLDVSAIGISGLREVRLPRARERPAVNQSEGVSAISLSVVSNGDRQGAVTLAPLTPSAGTRVWVRHTSLAHQYELSLNGGMVLHVGVNGPVRIGLPGAPAEPFDFDSPKPIILRPDSGEVTLSLTLPSGSQSTFSRQLSASDLSLFRIEHYSELERTLVHRVSTILSGTLYLESLNGRRHPLRPGEALHLKGVHGVIRTFRLLEDSIALTFHGHVTEMRAGYGKNPRSLMPTYLDWLQARHGLSLLWGTTIYLVGLLAGALRWWGISI
jgi:hypothetical protein